MNLLIMGPPGAGKGSQAALIKEHFNIAHISTGNMFREAIAAKTEVGILAKSYIDRGELVPDEVTNDLVKERLREDDVKNGFLLDGFPRTIAQAKAFAEYLERSGNKIDKVINLVVDDAVLISRITGRRVCIDCGATYHIETNKPKQEGICDVCGGSLIQREDDTVETVTTRVKVYYEKTRPLLDYYRANGQLVDIEGFGKIEDIFKEIQKTLEVA